MSEPRTPFWLGATLPISTLQAASKLGANQLVVGMILSSFRLWMDGQLLLSGDRSDLEFISIPLPVTRLSEGRPLKIALEIINNAGTLKGPDVLAPGFESGLSTWPKLVRYKRALAIRDSARPMALFGILALLAVIFFAAWLGNPARREYFYLALYAFGNALVQIKLMDIFYLSLSREAVAALGVIAYTWTGVFALFAGLSFARARRVVFAWGVPLGLSLPFALMLLFPSSHSRQALAQGFLLNLWLCSGRRRRCRCVPAAGLVFAAPAAQPRGTSASHSAADRLWRNSFVAGDSGLF
jgi:hypothetical protein